MDVVNLIDNIHTSFGSLLASSWVTTTLCLLQDYKVFNFVLAIGLLGVAAVVVVYFVKKFHRKGFSLKKERSEDSISRFRKRDKALFYGRKMLRKVKNISGQGKKRKMVMKFARRILQLKKESDTEQLKVVEPPPEYLQEDMLNDERMPPDALFMLQSIRVFGHFEKPIFLKLCKHTEILNVCAGSFLFKIGDEDENVYIVQSGKLNVSITSNDGANLSLKIVKPGETVTSLLSFTDVLTVCGHIYTSECIDCQRMQARWEAVGAKIKSRTNIARVNRATTGSATARRFDVYHVPAFVLFRQGRMYKYQIQKYDIDSLVSFAQDWYRNIQAEKVPPMKTPFDDLVSLIAVYLKDYPWMWQAGLAIFGIIILDILRRIIFSNR